MVNAFILCGPPCSGKSTFARNVLKHLPVCSTDNHLLARARKTGRTYNEEFQLSYKEAEEEFLRDIEVSQLDKDSFVIDRTNCTEKSRRNMLALIAKEYKKIAVYFPAYTPEVLIERAKGRPEQPIPDDVIRMFHNMYVLPKYSDGYDLVISVSELTRILTIMDFK